MAPATPEPVAVATPIPHHFAPEGTFYVIQYFSIETSSGIVGIKPGTRVRKIADLGENIKATDDKTEFTVSKEYLTNDLEIASQVAKIDFTSQALARSSGPAVITIFSATYGVPGRFFNVTDYLRQEVAAGGTEFQVDKKLTGYKDHTYNKAKTLTVVYSIGTGATQTVTAGEGNVIELSNPMSQQASQPLPVIQYVPVTRPSANPLERAPYNEKTVTTGRTFYGP